MSRHSHAAETGPGDEADLPVLRRTAARAILLDERDHVLLLQGRDPMIADAVRWWFTPGGGLKRGEEPEAALMRECWEELGVVPSDLHGPIARRHTAFEFDGKWLVQDSDFFWARINRFEPAPEHLTALEKRFILGWRWWSPTELRCTRQTVYPADLGALIGRVKSGADDLKPGI